MYWLCGERVRIPHIPQGKFIEIKVSVYGSEGAEHSGGGQKGDYGRAHHPCGGVTLQVALVRIQPVGIET